MAYRILARNQPLPSQIALAVQVCLPTFFKSVALREKLKKLPNLVQRAIYREKSHLEDDVDDNDNDYDDVSNTFG